MDSGANKEIKSRRERADMERTAKRVTRLTLGVRWEIQLRIQDR